MQKRAPWLFWDVDTQVDFMQADGKLYVPDAESVIPNVARLTEAARRRGIPVVASADDHEPGDPELSDAPDFQETYPPHCLRGTPGVRKIPETAIHGAVEIGHQPLTEGEIERRVADADAVLIHKKRFDVFSNLNAERLLRVLDPQRILVYGVALDVCNRYAVEGMIERGWGDRVAVVTDATKPIQAARAEGLLEAWKEQGVELLTTGEALARVGESGHGA